MNPENRLQWTLHDDGTLDIGFGSLSLRSAYPVWHGTPVRALAVEVHRHSDHAIACYRLIDATLTLELRHVVGGLSITARLESQTRAPGSLMILGTARVAGASSWIQNGNEHPLPKPGDAPVDDDHGLLNAVVASDGSTLAFGALDHRAWRIAGRVSAGDGWHAGMVFSIGFHLESITPGPQGLTLPSIHIRGGTAPFQTLRSFAREIAAEMDVRPRFDPATHWGSWYYHYYNFSLHDLLATLDGLDRHPSPGLRAVQIDAGYFTAPGDWLSPNDRWPGGLEPAFHAIADAGFLPGVWIAPYMAGSRSRLLADHPDWVLRRHDGSPVIGFTCFGENKVWGYRDEVWTILDTSHPEVIAYLDRCFRTLHAWGARFFKTDFLFWGLLSAGDDQVRRHAPGLTSVQRMRELFRIIREAIGPESYWLGCLAPFAPMIGFADGIRTGGDTGPDWSLDPNAQGHGAAQLVRSSWAMQFANGVLWHNDADALLVRDFHTNLSDAEATTLALWVAALGGAINTSDPLHECHESRRRLWRFCTPGPLAGETELPFWALPEHPLRVVVKPFPSLRSWAVLVVNPTTTRRSQRYAFSQLLGVDEELASELQVAEWGPMSAGVATKVESLEVVLDPHAHRLWWISPGGAAPPAGLTLGGAIVP
jgi:hypothetical protein